MSEKWSKIGEALFDEAGPVLPATLSAIYFAHRAAPTSSGTIQPLCIRR
jgi:hypothetical protein